MPIEKTYEREGENLKIKEIETVERSTVLSVDEMKKRLADAQTGLVAEVANLAELTSKSTARQAEFQGIIDSSISEIEQAQNLGINVSAFALPLLFAGAVGAIVFGAHNVKSSNITCKAFSTQEAAQQMFDTDRIKYKALDSDKDGKPCQNLPHQK